MDDAEIERLAKTIHEAVYVPMARREGRIGVPYEHTSEDAKELNRAVARWHVSVVASILAEWVQTGCDPLRSRVAELERQLAEADNATAQQVEPKTAEEWIERCNVDYLAGMRVEGRSNHLRHGLCLDCVRAYTTQQVEVWREALEESVKLQGHYATVLNQYDGGERIVFNDAEDWRDRLAMTPKARMRDFKVR